MLEDVYLTEGQREKVQETAVAQEGNDCLLNMSFIKIQHISRKMQHRNFQKGTAPDVTKVEKGSYQNITNFTKKISRRSYPCCVILVGNQV